MEKIPQQHVDEITNFIHSLPPQTLGLESVKKISVSNLPQGVWNFIYRVDINHRPFVFKMAPPAKSIVAGMIDNSGRGEFEALKCLEHLNLSPKPVLFIEPGPHFEYPVLIYEYVIGERMSFFDDMVMARAARAFAQIHSMEITPFEKRFRHRSETPESLLGDLKTAYERFNQRDDIVPDHQYLFSRYISRLPQVNANICAGEPCPLSLIHADPVPGNIILQNQSIFIIDWQTPMIGDPAYDVWAFLADAFTLWDCQEPPTETQKQIFIRTYLENRPDDTLLERIRTKEPYYLLKYGLHCSNRYHDYRFKKIPLEQVRGKEKNFEKYGATANIILARLAELLN
ncbi:MAG TPA: aminoglycoside phosphotransferase family protein [Anaerolineaceae bacterium]|nr:aminoglycoside phosphotransferase family protein [Anaerolineaceae bacterium]HPN52363.1 aminoglycoside phosphotransferase family protein [Anaerolineaceae bacterium]